MSALRIWLTTPDMPATIVMTSTRALPSWQQPGAGPKAIASSTGGLQVSWLVGPRTLGTAWPGFPLETVPADRAVIAVLIPQVNLRAGVQSLLGCWADFSVMVHCNLFPLASGYIEP